jgi:hypothetical protein
MNRLRDESGWDVVSERGIELLRRVPASPGRPDVKRRVWAALQEMSLGLLDRPRHATLKAFALSVVVVASAATAGAAIGGRWVARRIDRPGSGMEPQRVESRPRHRAATRRIADAWETPAAETPPVPVVDPVAVAPKIDARTPVRVVAHPAAAPLAEGRPEVLEALIALRRDHDADRAAGLLDRYLAASRHGALREEALALAIEAADARHDQAGARRLAHAYLAEFPLGRFGQFAQEHVLAAASASNAPAN